jgi:hypothetical protein
MIIFNLSNYRERLMKQDFRAFFLAMSELEKVIYAQKAGTSAA